MKGKLLGYYDEDDCSTSIAPRTSTVPRAGNPVKKVVPVGVGEKEDKPEGN